MIAYTIEAAIKSKHINKIIVSTEDNEIADVSSGFGAEIIKRPVELAQDDTKTAPVLIHAVSELAKNGYIPDIIVLLQATSPFRDESIIDEAIEKLINSDNDSVFTGFYTGITHGLWKKYPEGSMSCLYDYHLRPRRQEVELHQKIYCESGALYAIKYEAFVKH